MYVIRRGAEPKQEEDLQNEDGACSYILVEWARDEFVQLQEVIGDRRHRHEPRRDGIRQHQVLLIHK